MELKGNGFILRSWHKDDALALQKHADNVNISGCLLDRFPTPYTLADARFFISLKLNQNPVTNFAIAINDEVAGVISLDLREDIYRKSPLLGYWLSEQYWGGGIMPEAVKLITAYGFETLDIICIIATVLGGNQKSMRVLEKAGYIKQGVLKQTVVKNGEVLDEHVYATYK